MGKEITICAIIAARNEAHYLRYLLPMLAEQDIDVVILDNESTDECKEIYSLYLNKPIIEVVSHPYTGIFSLTKQLVLKKDIYERLSHDWLVHHDADEIFQHKLPGRTFRNAMEEADANGYNALNFEEFVFLPERGVDNFDTNHFTSMNRYYFFKPGENRLNRAWKRNAQVNNLAHGGHRLSGENLNIDPGNHILRHYIVKSEWHAQNKYLTRVVDDKDLEKGWHTNRLNLTEESLRIPSDSSFFYKLATADSKDFCRDNAATKHFWHW